MKITEVTNADLQARGQAGNRQMQQDLEKDQKYQERLKEPPDPGTAAAGRNQPPRMVDYRLVPPFKARDVLPDVDYKSGWTGTQYGQAWRDKMRQQQGWPKPDTVDWTNLSQAFDPRFSGMVGGGRGSVNPASVVPSPTPARTKPRPTKLDVVAPSQADPAVANLLTRPTVGQVTDNPTVTATKPPETTPPATDSFLNQTNRDILRQLQRQPVSQPNTSTAAAEPATNTGHQGKSTVTGDNLGGQGSDQNNVWKDSSGETWKDQEGNAVKTKQYEDRNSLIRLQNLAGIQK